MTCIIGVLDNDTNEMYIGGDSAASNGYSLNIRKDPKVFIKDNKFIIGFTSSFRMGQLLMSDKFIIREQNDNETNFHYMINAFIPAVQDVFESGGYLKSSDNVKEGGIFIVGYKNSLYKICSDFQVAETVENYISCGCGEDFALGSLYTSENMNLSTTERITKALEAASKYSVGVSGPFNIMKI